MTEGTGLSVRPRVWPAAVILGTQLAVSYGFAQFGSTNLQSVAGNVVAPLVGAIAMGLWWLFGSRVPKSTALLLLALLIPVLATIVLTQKNNYYGGVLTAQALPVISGGALVCAALGCALSWSLVRAVGVAWLVGVTAYFAGQHVQGVGGDFVPITVWRWEQGVGEVVADAATDVKGTATLPATITAADWPGFRGPGRDGHATGVTFATDWNTTPPKELWRRPIGAGHSSVVVAGDYGFTQEQEGTREVVLCFELATGKTVWSSGLPVKHDDTMGGEGPRATPLYLGGKLYTQSAGGLLQCLDARTGAPVWKQEMLTAPTQSPPQYGFASSPLAVGDLIVQFASGAGRDDLAAFNALTGAEVWSAAKDTGGYSSPHLATVAGVPQVLMLQSQGIVSVDPTSGATLWEHAWKQKQFPRCTQPYVTEDGGIALGANTDFGTRRIDVAKTDAGWDVKEAWTNDAHRPYFNDNVGHKGYLYGFDGNRLCCVDLKTGETKWQGSRYGGQVMVVTDLDLLLVLTEKGKVALVKADPTAFAEVASIDAVKGKTWNHPTIAHGRLIVRNSAEMACYELPGAAKP